jgi:hypothetical protein
MKKILMPVGLIVIVITVMVIIGKLGKNKVVHIDKFKDYSYSQNRDANGVFEWSFRKEIDGVFFKLRANKMDGVLGESDVDKILGSVNVVFKRQKDLGKNVLSDLTDSSKTVMGVVVKNRDYTESSSDLKTFRKNSAFLINGTIIKASGVIESRKSTGNDIVDSEWDEYIGFLISSVKK